MTNDVIADRLRPIIGNELVRCDPSDPKSIAELRERGINAVAAYAGKGSVNYGIQFLQQFEIIIHRELQNAINEFKLYQWERDRDGIVINTPVGTNDHLIAAARYGLSSISFAQKKQVKSKFDRGLLGLPV
jgi:phage terminase large subunit